ncbi:MAG TPA: tryptophan 2,3-dioxygenase family protein [Thermoanaerobaculia bacterium]|nr:tryptophan 2,3-dioxygenase family protein [Thermoanaerobaculia bacterium]
MPNAPVPTYWDYLKLDRLLALQGGLEEDESALAPDELHFIVVHQVYELWFKLVLRELALAREHLSAPLVPEERIPYVVHHLRRVNEILRLTVEQFRIMETLTPQDFLDFRDKLAPASGFQSFQMREIEIVLGLEESQRLLYGETDPLAHVKNLAAASPGGAHAWGRIESARRTTTLRAALHEWLYRAPIQGSSPGQRGDEEVVAEFLGDYLAASERFAKGQEAHVLASWGGDPEAIRKRTVAALSMAKEFLFAEDVPEGERARVKRIRAGLLFIESYRDLPLLAWPRLLVDAVVELEEQLVLWRTRHARMVERTIGRRSGTGGSSGVDYLDQTTKYRIFTELWAVRTLLLPRQELPDLKKRDAYGFAR